MRSNLVILFILLLPLMMRSQDATATIEDEISCAGEIALVAIDVTNFIDVAAMNIYISYDTNHAEFLSVQNVNPVITGSIIANGINGVVAMVYSSINPFTITSGKLLDLTFNMLGDSTYLPFETGTEIANIDLQIIPLETYPGSISNGLVIYDQPDNVQASPDTDVLFAISVMGSPDLQWQENSGSGWTDLQNNATYSGTDTDTLNIYNITGAFDGNFYRCMLTINNCSIFSDSALLEVASAFPTAGLGNVLSCPDAHVLEPLFVTDFNDIIEFTFNISYNTANLEFLGPENIHPDLLAGNLDINPIITPPGISIHWEHTSPLNISGGKLFDLNFNFASQNNILAFETGTQAINSFLNPIELNLSNGSINQHELPLILQQPEDITVTEFEDAFFSVTASGATQYQWMVSTDQGTTWNNLAESIPYYNTNTNTLTISPATIGLDGYYYACTVRNQYCPITSNAGILTVETMVSVSGISIAKTLHVSPNPFRDHLWLRSGIPMDHFHIIIRDQIGKTAFSSDQISLTGQSSIRINLSALPEGLYFMEIVGYSRGKMVRDIKKIMKIN